MTNIITLDFENSTSNTDVWNKILNSYYTSDGHKIGWRKFYKNMFGFIVYLQHNRNDMLIRADLIFENESDKVEFILRNL